VPKRSSFKLKWTKKFRDLNSTMLPLKLLPWTLCSFHLYLVEECPLCCWWGLYPFSYSSGLRNTCCWDGISGLIKSEEKSISKYSLFVILPLFFMLVFQFGCMLPQTFSLKIWILRESITFYQTNTFKIFQRLIQTGLNL